MKGYVGSFIAFLSNLLGLYVMISWSSALAAPANLGPSNSETALDRPPEDDPMDRVPVMSALDPQEARRRPTSVQPAVWNREAVLSDPWNGRELIDRVVAREEPHVSYSGHNPVA
jgi:hypothetical protein